MTSQELKTKATQARIKQIEEKITEAAERGDFETRVEMLLPEQKQWLIDSGISFREIIQKQGTQYDITWE